jgi:hypothetical protein
VPACNHTTKVPALAPVQRAEPSPAESLTKILPLFSTEFSTLVLKTFAVFSKKEERAGPEKSGLATLSPSVPLPVRASALAILPWTQ